MQTDYLDAFPVPPKEYNATMCLLGKVMTNGLASNFNFDGQKQKLGFQKTRLWKTIEDRPIYLFLNFVGFYIVSILYTLNLLSKFLQQHSCASMKAANLLMASRQLSRGCGMHLGD